jgi:segregation and condensation protein A
MQEKIFDMLFQEQDVTWRNIIFEAVKKEEMNPWDIDLSDLAKRFLEMVKQLKEMDFKISGKIILAAAILLRLKSNKLLTDDLGELDRLIALSEQTEEEFYDELEHEQFVEKNRLLSDEDKYKLIPRTPQPRKRKVSVYDLVEALNQALEVKKRRVKRHRELDETEVVIPERKRDITNMIGSIYGQIMNHFLQRNMKRMQFSQLIPSGSKEDKIFTFIPLLHLSNQQKVNLEQEYHLADIDVYVPKEKEITAEIIQQEVEEIKTAYKAEEEEVEKETLEIFDKSETTKKKKSKKK